MSETVTDPFNPNAWVDGNGWYFDRVGGVVHFRPAGLWIIAAADVSE